MGSCTLSMNDGEGGNVPSELEVAAEATVDTSEVSRCIPCVAFEATRMGEAVAWVASCCSPCVASGATRVGEDVTSGAVD
ncbi:MAG: hypothetical protein Q4A24_02885 [Akkermansia sp.]|nr:hypothetical protein [Akkermansia sp.]